MLSKRIITALIGIPIAVYVVNCGGWLFNICILFLSVAAWSEYKRMLENRDIKIWFWGGIFLILLLMACAVWGNTLEILLVVTLGTLLIPVKTIIANKKFSPVDAAYTIFGLNYIGLCFMHLLLLRYLNSSSFITTSLGSLSMGAVYVWLAFVSTWASDTFAYFTGSLIGKHKLCPAVSPGKTIEGTIGGLVGSVLCASLLGHWLIMPISHTAILGLITGLAATLGDLAESVIKRHCGVKDSGNILPGHGGILDRFDSILFVAPTVYYYIYTFLI